jgi:iron complex outermembrane receptor protein
MEITGFPDVGGRYTNTRGVYNGSNPRSQVFEAENVLTFDLGPTKHRLIAGARLGESRNTSFSISSNVTNHNHFTDGPRRLAGAFSTFVPSAYTRSRGKETALYAIDQIGFFADRLKLLGGVRRTEVEQVAVSGNQSTLVAQETTPQAGAYFEVVKGVAIFANYSRTFEPQFSVDVFGQIAPNVEGKGKEAGLKVELGDGKLSGTLSAFQIERAGEVRRDFLREIAEGRTPIFIPGGTSMSEGTELELTFTPTRNYQAVLGYAFIWDAKVIQDTTTPQFVGQRLPLVPRHQASFWNRYTFVEGALKGLFVGAGVRYATRMNSINNVQFYLFQSGYTVVDALIGYQMKLGNRPTKLQVNVKNLFDRDYGDGRWNMPADPVTVYFTAEFTF